MLKKFIYALLILAAGGALYFFLVLNNEAEGGEQAPDFTATTINGSQFALSDLRGKYVLLSFWGSWCGPCIKENPNLKQLYDAFGGRSLVGAEGFEIVSIALEKSDRQTLRIIEKSNLNWPYHVIDVTRFVMMSEYAQLYGVKELPSKFFIDPEGNIIQRDMSIADIRQYLTVLEQ